MCELAGVADIHVISLADSHGNAIYDDASGKEVFQWNHAWVRVGEEVIDGNVYSLVENPLVPDQVRVPPYWGSLSQKYRKVGEFHVPAHPMAYFDRAPHKIQILISFTEDFISVTPERPVPVKMHNSMDGLRWLLRNLFTLPYPGHVRLKPLDRPPRKLLAQTREGGSWCNYPSKSRRTDSGLSRFRR
jgi:hypothetical protein